MKYRNIFSGVAVTLGLVATVVAAPTVSAADDLKCAILPKDICNSAKSQPGTGGDVSKTGVFQILVWVINILTVGVGMVAVGVVVYAGILYTSAGGSNEQVAKAKSMITNMVIGVIAYALMYFALNWLIPGGVIG